MDQKEEKKMPGYMKFVIGGLGGMGGTCVVQPMDLIKTRMQVSGAAGGERMYKNSFHCIQMVISKEGPLALYKGIGAGLLRQATYTTGRMGVYTLLNDWYKQKYAKSPNVLASIGMGMTAGAVGAFIGTPAEVVLIRMTSDGRLPPEERRNYKNVVNALTRITKEEGLFALWRGCVPTVARAMVVNMTQLASYSQFKTYFRDGPMKMSEGLPLHIAASLLSGLLTTIASMPLDMSKTRLQNMKVVNGKAEYSGTVHVLVSVIRNEGLFSLWKGFTPYFCRLAPHTVLTFVFIEQLTKSYSRYILGVESKGSGL